MPVKNMEQLASLASRYGRLCGALRPFTRALYGAYTSRPRHVAAVLRVEAKRAIRLWRAMLCALRLREDLFEKTVRFVPAKGSNAYRAV